MPKHLLADIKPMTTTRRKSVADPAARAAKHSAAPLPRRVPFDPAPAKPASNHALWYIAAIAVVSFLFSLSFLFEHADVTVTPKSVQAAFVTGDTFTASKDPTDDSGIAYTVMSLSGDESIKLPSTSTKTETMPAKGTVTLYNAYSAAPYKLVKSTRLITSDGKLYRLDSAATIPGYTKSAAGSVVPGSADAAVTAAVAGDASNLDSGEFTLPGLDGTAQAKTVYARTKSAITGGISGTLYFISPDSASAAMGTLKSKLQDSLLAKAKVQVPDGYVFFPNAIAFTSADSVAVPYSKESSVPITLHGTLTAYLLKQDTLVKAIAEKSVSQYAGEPVTVPKIESLILTPSGPMNPDIDTTFSFTLAGAAPVVWTVDPVKVQTLLAGQKKSQFETILGQQAGVDKAEVVIKPFWKQSFPKDASRITVKVNQIQ